MTTNAILRAARDLIADPEHWTTCRMACDINGNTVDHNSTEAVRFCARGAIEHVIAGQPGSSEYIDAVNKLARYCGSITYVNDFEGHTAIMRAFNKVLADDPEESA